MWEEAFWISGPIQASSTHEYKIYGYVIKLARILVFVLYIIGWEAALTLPYSLC